MLVGTPAAAQDETERSASSANFSITWVDDPGHRDAPDLTDADGDQIPDAVEDVLRAFEQARAFLVGELGYQAPPVEGRYPLYIAAASGRGYAQVLHEGEDQSKPSYILVPTRVARTGVSFDALRAFAVHEFHHAIQIGLDAGENHWITEATSVWLEERWLDELDRNFFWLRSFVPFPERGLAYVGGQHEYGAFLFLEFLVERYGGGSADLVRELWELMAVPEAIPGAPNLDSFGAIAAVLERRGATVSQAWGEFMAWRYDLRHFEEGPSYIAALEGLGWPRVSSVHRVATQTCRLATEPLPPLASEYLRLRPARPAPDYGSALLTVAGEPGTSAMVRLKLRRLPIHERILVFDEHGVADTDFPFGRAQARHVTVGLGSPPLRVPEQEVTYSLRYPGLEEVEASPVWAPLEVDYFNGVSLSGNVTCAGAPAALAEVLVTEREVIGGAERTFPVRTGLDGSWHLLVRPEANVTYRAEVVDPLLGHAIAQPAFVGVHVEVSLEPEAAVLPSGTPVTVIGEVVPAHEGAVVTLQFRRPERPWRTGVQVVTDSAGGYSAQLALPRDGVWELRALADPRDQDHFDGTSVVRAVRIGRG